MIRRCCWPTPTGYTTGGDVTLTSTAFEDLDWTFTPFDTDFQGTSSQASITVGASAVIKGRDITVHTAATTLKSADQDVDIDPAGDSGGLGTAIDETDIVEVSGLAAGVLSQSLSKISILAGARIEADQGIVLDADALSESQITTRNRYVGVTYGSSSPTAEIVVENGAVLHAASGDLNVTADADNQLAIKAVVPTGARSPIFHSRTARAGRYRMSIFRRGSTSWPRT